MLCAQPHPFLSPCLSLLVTQSLRSAALEDCALCQETLSSSELAAKTRDGDLEGACGVWARARGAACWVRSEEPVWTARLSALDAESMKALLLQLGVPPQRPSGPVAACAAFGTLLSPHHGHTDPPLAKAFGCGWRWLDPGHRHTPDPTCIHLPHRKSLTWQLPVISSQEAALSGHVGAPGPCSPFRLEVRPAGGPVAQ